MRDSQLHNPDLPAADPMAHLAIQLFVERLRHRIVVVSRQRPLSRPSPTSSIWIVHLANVIIKEKEENNNEIKTAISEGNEKAEAVTLF